MVTQKSGRRPAYVYRHLTRDQASKLSEARNSTDQIEGAYSGYFLLTQSEYCLLLPLLNPFVIFQNNRQLQKLCDIASIPKDCRRKMKRNLWLQSAMGFVPIANVVFTRKFKCNTRNLHIFEKHMQDEEDKAMFRESTDNTDDSGLPTHITRLFNKCPVVKRKPGSGLASGQRSAVVSIYYSPCISLSELGIVDACSDSTSSKHSNDSVASTVISRSASKANIISKHASLCESVTANKDVPAQSGWAFAPATQVSQMLWGTAS